MDTKFNPKEAQGVDLDEELETMDKAKIEAWMVRDLQACVAFLTAILQDKEMQSMMSTWFNGRIQNWKTERQRKAGQSVMFDPKR